MADDIVTRLRDGLPPQSCKCVRCDAADEIERLRAEVLDWQRTVRAHEAENDELHDDSTRLLQEVGRLRAEVQHVRVALLLAVEELFTHRQYEAWTHEMLFNQFLEEARRG